MAGLASLLSRRTMNPRAGGAQAMRRNRPIRRPILQRASVPSNVPPWPGTNSPVVTPGVVPPPGYIPPPGGEHGGQVKGYQMGGRTMNPRAAGAAAMLRNRPQPTQMVRHPLQARPGGWQLGGEVGAAPEEVAMASEIFARATPEQQDQITGGGGGPGMMDEEAAIGEALAMAMGGGGGPPMGGPPMNGAPPMGGLI